MAIENKNKIERTSNFGAYFKILKIKMFFDCSLVGVTLDLCALPFPEKLNKSPH